MSKKTKLKRKAIHKKLVQRSMNREVSTPLKNLNIHIREKDAIPIHYQEHKDE